jgi:hypothetical protein
VQSASSLPSPAAACCMLPPWIWYSTIIISDEDKKQQVVGSKHQDGHYPKNAAKLPNLVSSRPRQSIVAVHAVNTRTGHDVLQASVSGSLYQEGEFFSITRLLPFCCCGATSTTTTSYYYSNQPPPTVVPPTTNKLRRLVFGCTHWRRRLYNLGRTNTGPSHLQDTAACLVENTPHGRGRRRDQKFTNPCTTCEMSLCQCSCTAARPCKKTHVVALVHLVFEKRQYRTEHCLPRLSSIASAFNRPSRMGRHAGLSVHLLEGSMDQVGTDVDYLRAPCLERGANDRFAGRFGMGDQGAHHQGVYCKNRPCRRFLTVAL